MNLLKKGALLALVLVTLFACSNDATENLPAVEKGAGDTYATISLQMAKATTRAKMDETWGGRDAIETIDVFWLIPLQIMWTMNPLQKMRLTK